HQVRWQGTGLDAGRERVRMAHRGEGRNGMSVSAPAIYETAKNEALSNASQASGTPTLKTLREASLRALEGTSFPSRKTEAWKYTSIQPLADGHLRRRAEG